MVSDVSHGVVGFTIANNFRTGQGNGARINLIRFVTFNGLHTAVFHVSYKTSVANVDGGIIIFPTEVNNIANLRSIVSLTAVTGSTR